MSNNFVQSLQKYVYVQENISLASHTTFAIGGQARYFIQPTNSIAIQACIRLAHQYGIACMILGSGANMLIPDEGFKGLVLCTLGLQEWVRQGNTIRIGAGMHINDAICKAAREHLVGLDFAYGMPSSVGGAVWMNARCYNSEIADILYQVGYIDMNDQQLYIYEVNKNDFKYKYSPFQNMNCIIVWACFLLQTSSNIREVWNAMFDRWEDRVKKGHFLAPCGGSFFKNNRAFGMSTGQLIDTLGLRGLRIGGACISQKHANIIINDRYASAADIRCLALLVQKRIYDAYGYYLEPEVCIVPINN